MDEELRNKLLRAIHQLESSGGKNRIHSGSEEAIGRGDRAVGGYGLKPNTIIEHVRRSKRDGKQVPPSVEQLSALPPIEMYKTLKDNPGLDDEAANFVLTNNMMRSEGDPVETMMRHRFGSNIKRKNLPKYLDKGKGYAIEGMKLIGNEYAQDEQFQLPDSIEEKAKKLVKKP